MLKIFNRKKPPEIEQHCGQCGLLYKQKDLYRFSWRFTDKKKVYHQSERKFIRTGYKYVCKSCLKTLTL